MKKLFLTFTLLFTTILLAQTKEPVLEKQGKLVKATYFHENGTVAQTGFFKNGKIHGQWKAYNQAGKKIAVANYDAGVKTGKWFFWTDKELKEVDYNNNKIVTITKWKDANSVVINEDE